MEKVTVERIIVVNAPKSWTGATEVEVEEIDGKKGGVAKADMSYHAEESGKAAWASVRNR